MELNQLEENKLNKLDSVLKEVFGMKFDFAAGNAKLQKVKESTQNKISSLKDSGVDVNDKQFQKLLLVLEGINEVMKNTVMENDLDQAEVLLAAKQMADDLQKMAEDLASMQVEGLMSITQGMKEEVGVAEAEAFEASASASIESALEAVKAATDGVNNAVLTAQGQAPEPSTDMAMDTGMDMDPEAPAEEPMDDMGDDFEGVDAAADDSDADGREMKEDSYLAALRMVKEAQDNGQINKDVLKKAFAELKK
tara:strand:+ start:16629 stop:17384 length:756 start_codon:yes stop_codon:yes gene_type:complete